MNTLRKPITEWQKKRFERLTVLDAKVMGDIFEISNHQEFVEKRCKELETETHFFTYEILRYYESPKSFPSEAYENDYIGVTIYIHSNWKNHKN